MQHKTKLFLMLVAVVAASLACATFSGNDPAPTIAPTNPPPPTATAPPPTATTPPTDDRFLFQDDFSDPNSGWDRFSDEGGGTDYLNGGYLIGVYTDVYFYWANPYRTFQDVIIEVDAELITDEEDNQYGIVCRQTDIDNWYVLVISGDGYASIRKRFLGGDLEYLTDWVESSAINTGMASNKLRAECVGNRLSLYVNGVLAIEAFDSDLVSGDVGLLAGTFSATQTEVMFDNFTVSNP
ncbi:MAG TPA: hypothetical protein DCY42_10805 [Chloroflexi bacterium]|nr:hypothetical protein [Chloroflexota bacterium]